MNTTVAIFTQIVERSARKLLLKRSKAADDYFSYVAEVGCGKQDNSHRGIYYVKSKRPYMSLLAFGCRAICVRREREATLMASNYLLTIRERFRTVLT